MDPDSIPDRLEGLRAGLGARAAGFWKREGSSLVLAAFAAHPELPAAVASRFVEATHTVALDPSRKDLGIVGAALDGDFRVSRVAELPAERGSGYWLRAFGAERSVAVPLEDGSVGSVALPADRHEDDGEVAERIRRAFLGLDERS